MLIVQLCLQTSRHEADSLLVGLGPYWTVAPGIITITVISNSFFQHNFDFGINVTQILEDFCISKVFIKPKIYILTFMFN